MNQFFKQTLLFKPVMLSIKNWWQARPWNILRIFQDTFIIFILSILLILVYATSNFMLTKVREFPEIVYLAPETLIGLILFFLFIMSYFSHIALSIGTFFFSADLDFLAASPISKSSQYLCKSNLVFLIASWMPILFLGPMLLAFVVNYNTNWLNTALIPLIVLPVFYLSNLFAQITAFVVIESLFVKFKKLIFLPIFGLGIFFVIKLSKLILIISKKKSALSALSQLFSTLSFSQKNWLPSSWAAKIIGQLIENAKFTSWSHLTLLFSSCLFLNLTAYILWDKTRTSREKLLTSKKSNISLMRRSSNILKLILNERRADRVLIAKEFLLFLRDAAQITQVLLLGFLAILYISHLHILQSLDFFPQENLRYWRNILFICNIMLAIFFCTAICTRLVYPSLSLEGRSFWLIQTAPIQILRIVKSKFIFWYIPLALTMMALFGIGAYLLQASTSLVICHILAAAIISYGLIGLALSFGTALAKFDWEHSSQLAMSLGSCLFMLHAVLLAVLSIILLGAVYVLSQKTGSSPLSYLTLAGGITTLGLAHFFIAKFSLLIACRYLEKKLSN